MLAAGDDTALLQVVFDTSTFTTSPSLTGNGTTFVGRDTTKELLIGLSTDEAGAVTAVGLIGHTDNSRTLSAIAALWVAGEPNVSPLVDAYLTTIDADVADIAVAASDGGTWTIIDIDQSVGFGKVQNGDGTVAVGVTNELLFEMVTLVDPL